MMPGACALARYRCIKFSPDSSTLYKRQSKARSHGLQDDVASSDLELHSAAALCLDGPGAVNGRAKSIHNAAQPWSSRRNLSGRRELPCEKLLYSAHKGAGSSSPMGTSTMVPVHLTLSPAVQVLELSPNREVLPQTWHSSSRMWPRSLRQWLGHRRKPPLRRCRFPWMHCIRNCLIDRLPA